jgi:glycosyltransferase involved in cell wall biosynthesis
MDVEIVEVCLGTAQPVTSDPVVIPFEPLAPRRHPGLRPPLRYLDTARLVRAWRAAASAVTRSRPDVVYANPCQYLQAPAGLLFTSQPSVYFCDEPRRIDYEPDAKATLNPTTRALYAPLRRAERRLDRVAVGRAGLILTNSRYTASGVRHAYGRDAQAIPLGVATRFHPVSVADAAGHVLSVGMLIPSKGHDLVIRAAGRSATRRPVVIVSPRPDDAGRRWLEEVAREEGVELRIRVGISDDELRALYSGAFATAYMARAEPLGLASMEAQACGSPVVVADEGGLPETNEAGVTGLAVPRRVDELAAAFDALGDERRRDAMAESARLRGAKLGWQRSADAVVAALRQVLGTSPVTR